jgi:N-acetyl-gamma-glutamyl-phosphate reductase/acetylglutamate kinase
VCDLQTDESFAPPPPRMQTGEDLRGGVRPYALTDHIHERESGYQLSNLMSSTSEPLKLSFVPNVAPWFSGIISVLNAPLKQEVRADDIWKLYEEKYGNEPLVRITKGVPDVMDATGKHGWRIGGVQVHSSLKRVVVVVSEAWSSAILGPAY